MTQIVIYASVPFNDKDLAKKLGGKWSIENKAWYWQYKYDEYLDNGLDLHTYFFKPFLIMMSKIPGINASQHKKNINDSFKIAKERHLSYSKDNVKPQVIKKSYVKTFIDPFDDDEN